MNGKSASLSLVIKLLGALWFALVLSCHAESPSASPQAPQPQGSAPSSGPGSTTSNENKTAITKGSKAQSEGLLAGGTLAGQNPGLNGLSDQTSGISYLEGDHGFYLTYEINKSAANFTFYCPGDSFYIGMHSVYDSEVNDRRHRFLCQFFQDGQGRPIRKAACTVQESKTGIGEDRSFSCPAGSFLSGQESRFDQGSKDRSERFECCQMRTHDNKKLAIDQQTCSERVPSQLSSYEALRPYVNDEVNEFGGELAFSCQTAAIVGDGVFTGQEGIQEIPNAILYQIKSRYSPGHKDRRFSFTCCQLTNE